MATTRFPNGISTNSKTQPLGELIIPDNTSVYQFMDDFDKFQSAGTYATGVTWVIAASVGTATLDTALTTASQGILKLASGAAANNHVYLRTPVDATTPAAFPGSVRIETGKELWYKTLVEPLGSTVQPTSAINAQYVFGLQSEVIATSPFAGNNEGIYFRINSDDFTVDFVTGNGTAENSIVVAQFDYTDEKTEFAFYYDGKTTIRSYINGVSVGSLDTSVLTTNTVNPVLAIENGSSAGSDSQNLRIDYVYVAQDR